MRFCTDTGKRRYESQRLAKRLARTLHNRIRVYRCPHCHDWHITDAEKNIEKAKRFA